MAGDVTTLKTKQEPTPTSTAPHVLQAISAVMATMAKDGISKDRKNQSQGYNFRGIDDVYNALSSALTGAHLVVIPKVLSRDVVERQTKSGGALFVVTVSMEFRFLSSLDGSEITVGPFDGEASDSGDKATNKAMSAAYKYMAMQTFCIPTEGDNDADATTHEVAPKQERDDTDQRLIEFKADCGARIAKCDTPEEVNSLWKKVQSGSGFKMMSERLPKLAQQLVKTKDDRLRDLGATIGQTLEDEIPY